MKQSEYLFRELETLPVAEFTPPSTCAEEQLDVKLGLVCFA